MQFVQVRPETEVGKEPVKSYEGDAGYDLFCSRHTSIAAGAKGQIATGIAVDIPAGVFAQVLPRSGTFYRKGLLVHPGVIDSGYRGEIQILAYNPYPKTVFIGEGERVAQLLFFPMTYVRFAEVAKLTAGDRGEKGLGSTGGFGGGE